MKRADGTLARMSLWRELQRRKVVRVAVVYAVTAWILIQIIVAISGPLSLPDWVDTFVIVLLGLGFPVAGQHGLERRSADGVLHSHREGPPGYHWLCTELEALCERYEGLSLEPKGATLALHYRQAPGLASYVHRTTRAAVSTLRAAGAEWSLQPGKSVIEIKPAGRDKGAAILDYLSEAPFSGRLPVFVVDDAQIVQEILRKDYVHGEHCGVHITVNGIED